jgi:eukaryotic-like serine/threonine-protein kinase
MTGDEDEGIGAPPEPDALARAVRRSRVANALFDAGEEVRIGRYQLLERVGTGGIGVVWGAWDPELERRVAIKLLRPVTGVPRERIVLEGQALAKLSHPNVVPVYDVGVHGDRVYLVMEWVRGQTLRAFTAGTRSIREIVGVYRAAGEGLAAAHDAGLIHRDFKPDNAICGDDGRVRVLDFGLARVDRDADEGEGGDVGPDRPTRGAGTPRYMAPEQATGAALTPAADQYAFCVSLREALQRADRPELPRWLDAILTRGTSRDASQRYASMHELLHALGRDPARLWRRRIVVSTVLVFVVVAFLLGTLRSSTDEVVPCAGGGAEIAKSWNADARARMVAHLRGLGAYGAGEADRLAADMTRYGQRWASVQRDACMTHERREMTEPVYARTLGCIARARIEYATVIEVLSTVPASRLAGAIEAARGLPAIEQCTLDSAVSGVAPPRPEIVAQAARVAEQIDRASVLARTDDPEGVAATRAAVSAADELGYTPLVARAYLAHGAALLRQQDGNAAIPALRRAAVVAIEAFDDPTFVEAHAREVYARVMLGEPQADSEYAEHVARRAGGAGAFARALLFNNLGTVRLAAGDAAGARGWFDRAIADTRVVEQDAELLAAFGNRALVTDDPQERDRLLERARTALAQLLGDHHRKTLDVRFQAAFFLTDPRQASAALEELCALYRRFHPTVTRTIADCAFELGWLAEERGDVPAARAAMVGVPAIGGPVPEAAAAYVLALDGQHAEAAAAARAVGDSFRTVAWQRFQAADGYRLAAASNAKLGRTAEARADARTALRLLEELTHLARMANYQRRLARTRALLAHLSAPNEAARLARVAADWYRAAGGYDERVRELDAIASRRLKAGSR